MWLGLTLTLLAGMSIGVFGAGGSILMVPILVYALGIPVKGAMAMSLLVVGTTSAVALLTHGRAKHVRWKTGSLFGLAGMAGAYAGARVADYVPEAFLLVGFSLLMIVAAVAMLRGSRVADLGSLARRASEVRLVSAVGLGAGVGFVAGLVGAGGGFLVVPVLVLFGGLALRPAIATSLLVVSLQAFAGLVGHASYLELDWTLAAAVTVFALAGSAMGSRLSAQVSALRLQRGLSWFVATIGVMMLGMQIPSEWFATLGAWLLPLAPLFGGAVIGLAASLLWLLNGRIAGVSGIAGGLLGSGRGDRLWRALFLIGLASGGLLMRYLDPAAFEGATVSPGMLIFAGFLVGAGTTFANGCTSGHGVCGVSRLSPRSLIAVGSFMAAGVITVYLSRHVIGAAP